MAPAGPGAPSARSLAARRPPLLLARPGATDAPLGGHGLQGHVFRAQRFRFSEEPGLGEEGAVLEVRVPQVRAAAPAQKCGPLRPGSAALLSPPGGGGLEREWGPASCLRMDHRAKGLV